MARDVAYAEVKSLESLDAFLKSWWSNTYNRPLKDPLLQEYNTYELLYEFHERKERELAKDFFLELESDKIEEEREQQTLDWIEEEERREREQEEAELKLKKDEEWMLEQLKKEHGDDFGDDINIDFSE
jgi:hypothetical protein